MKALPVALKAHYQQGTTTLATCWKVTRTDGQVFGFTEYDQDLTIDGVTYLARTGFTPTATETQTRLAVDNLNADGILDSEIITAEDLSTGKWDYAGVEVFKVNSRNVSQGKDILVSGRLGEVKVGRTQFEAEVRGLSNAYAQRHAVVYQAGCRANLGDARCGVDLTPYTFTGTLTSVSDDGLTIGDESRSEGDGFFDYGQVTMNTGTSEGLSMEIKSFAGGLIVLQMEFAQGVAIGDEYTIKTGCGKRFQEDCIGRYSNGDNFRGEPHIPGMDKIMLFGGQK
jgi:uncharacterized phage protein (TIGR02218 family)